MEWKTVWAMVPCACMLPEVSEIASFLLIPLLSALEEHIGTLGSKPVAYDTV